MKTAIDQRPMPERWLGPLSEIVGNMPVSYFDVVLGLAGLGNAWRGARQAWQLPDFVAEWIYLLAGLLWVALVFLFVLKALLAPAKLVAEAAHPVQCCFIGLAGVATMLIAGGLLPYARTSACAMFGIGFAFTLCFALWRSGGLGQGERHPETTTAVLYLPKAAFLVATALVLVSPVLAYDFGRPATQGEIALWDIEVRPDGKGLPTGSGTVAQGKQVFADNCSACHGDNGVGGIKDRLVGGQGTLASPTPLKTVGSFWPYATTLFDYVHRTMRYQAPGALSNDDSSAVAAYILYLNDILPADSKLDRDSLPKVMPNPDGLVPDPEFDPAKLFRGK